MSIPIIPNSPEWNEIVNFLIDKLDLPRSGIYRIAVEMTMIDPIKCDVSFLPHPKEKVFIKEKPTFGTH